MLARKLYWTIAIGLVCAGQMALADIARPGEKAPRVAASSQSGEQIVATPAPIALKGADGGGVAGTPAPWFDDFESYTDGQFLDGGPDDGGWEAWDESPGAGGHVTSAQNHTPGGSLSVDIVGGVDLIHQYAGHDSGQWSYSTWMYIPSNLNGQTYFLIQKEYNHGGPYQWSVQLTFNSADGQIDADCGGENVNQMAYVTNEWVQIEVIIDLDIDYTFLRYNGAEVCQYRWKTGVFGDDPPTCPSSGCIGSVDLFANGASSVYYDDIALEPSSEAFGACCNDDTSCTNGSEADCAGSFHPGVICAEHSPFLCPNPACTEGSGACFEANWTPGCYQDGAADPTLCCTLVCNVDAWCCGSFGGTWDFGCADLADALCIAPDNDNCEDAPMVDLVVNGGSVEVSGNNAGATSDCDLVLGPEVWVAFTIAEEADVTFDLCFTFPPFDPVQMSKRLVIGCPCEALEDEGPEGQCFDGNAVITWPCLAPGTYYYPIRTGPGYTGDWNITITAATPGYDCAPPPNDNCEDADHWSFPAGGGTHEYAGNNLNATRDCQTLGDGTGHAWISFEVAEPSEVHVDFCDMGDFFNVNYLVMTGDCPCSALIFAETNGYTCPNGAFEAYFSCQQAGTYYYPIYSEFGGAEGDYTINVTVDPLNCEAGCMGSLVSADPASGTEDARQPHPPGVDPADPALRQGIGSADEPIMITTDASGATPSCFTLCETAADPHLGANGIASVTEGPTNTYAVVLNHAIAPGGWTAVTYEGAYVEYLSHPANANADSVSNANDVLSLVNMLNGVEDPPFGLYSSDIDHSGAFNASDVLRAIDLLNGAIPYAQWIGFPRPTNDSCPPAPPVIPDVCDDAHALACGDTHSILISDGYTSGGTGEDPSSSCEINGGGPWTHDASWWYTFTADATQTITVSMCATADIEDAVVTMFNADSTCGSLAEHACDDDACVAGFGPSELTASVVAGETYIILVDRYTGGTSTDGPYIIEISCP